MNLNTYQQEARKLAQYPDVGNNYNYPALGLIGEFGELAEKFKKLIRDDNNIVTDKKREEIKKESGDCMWYIANLLCEFNLDLEEINTKKLKTNNETNDYVNYIFIMLKEVYNISNEINLLRTNKITKQDPWLSICILYACAYFVHYLSVLLSQFNMSIQEIMETNINKLQDRKRRGVITGSGDNR